MKFTPQFLDDIRARLPVSQVVSARVKLRKQGREWRGLSPFTAEKTPSFYVNDQKMRWFDFSAGRNGNIFDFLMETEGLTFPEAVERLAAEAGVALPVQSREEEARERVRDSAAEALELATAFYEAQLRGREGGKARAYLDGRQMLAAAQAEFRIGYATSERFALRDHLAARNVPVETMIEAGLLVHGDDIAVPFDRFRDRVMFPICDRNGRVIAFGGRALDKDAPAKYLNSPETVLFHKGACLYNHHRARKAAHMKDRVIAVEGYVDVIALSMAGFAEAVAPLGTALTPEQCALLWRMSEEPVLCFDGDRAGRKAAHRAIDTALPLLGPGRSLRFALLPDGLDPDDLIRVQGAAGIEAALAGSIPLVDLLWSREVEAQPLDTPERRAALERRLFDVTRTIADETLRRYYGQEFSARLRALTGQGQRQPGPQRRRTPWRPGGMEDNAVRPSDRKMVSSELASMLKRGGGAVVPAREALIVMILFNHPELVGEHAEEIAALDFTHSGAAALRDVALRPSAGPSALRAAAEARGLSPVLASIEVALGRARLASIQADAARLDAAASLRQALALHHRTKALNRELRAAEAILATDPSERNLEMLRDIRTQISAIDGTEAAIEGFGAASQRESGTI